VGRRDPLGAVEERGQLATVQAPLGGWVHAGVAHVLSRVAGDAAVEVGEPVIAAHRGQAPIDGRRGQTPLLHPGPIQLEVRPRRKQRRHPGQGHPRQVLAQIRTVGLEGPAAVASEEGHRSQLRLIQNWLICSHHGGRSGNRIEHRHRAPPQHPQVRPTAARSENTHASEARAPKPLDHPSASTLASASRFQEPAFSRSERRDYRTRISDGS
jgi:hypothetical protein